MLLLPTSMPARLRDPSSPCSSFSTAALSLASASASLSASGESGIVSKEEMLGDRERSEVGVEGMEEDDMEYEEG